MKVLKLAVLLMCVFWTSAVVAQESKRWQQNPQVYLPKAILIQLRTEKRKIDFFEKAGRHKEAEQVRKDVQGVNEAMMNDFRDNFKFCPFYFFADTNIDLIKTKKFDGVLLGSDMKPATNLKVNESRKDYFIVYYGIPEREKMKRDGEMAGRTMHGAGLVVTDYNYIQLDKPSLFYYYSNRGYYQIHGKNSAYYYSSDKYDIEYYALASKMFEDFKQFFK